MAFRAVEPPDEDGPYLTESRPPVTCPEAVCSARQGKNLSGVHSVFAVGFEGSSSLGFVTERRCVVQKPFAGEDTALKPRGGEIFSDLIDLR